MSASRIAFKRRQSVCDRIVVLDVLEVDCLLISDGLSHRNHADLVSRFGMGDDHHSVAKKSQRYEALFVILEALVFKRDASGGPSPRQSSLHADHGAQRHDAAEVFGRICTNVREVLVERYQCPTFSGRCGVTGLLTEAQLRDHGELGGISEPQPRESRIRSSWSR